MSENQTLPDRKRLRAEGYDYAQPGWYFVTICTQLRVCLLGHIKNAYMYRSPAGQMVAEVLGELPQHFAHIEIEPFVVMPNHIHAIVKIGPVNDGIGSHSLSDIVSSFKLQTTHRYADGVRQSSWKPFPGKLWQRSFHDRIVPQRS